MNVYTHIYIPIMIIRWCYARFCQYPARHHKHLTRLSHTNTLSYWVSNMTFEKKFSVIPDEVFAQAHPRPLSKGYEGSCNDLPLVLWRKSFWVKLFWIREEFRIHVESGSRDVHCSSLWNNKIGSRYWVVLCAATENEWKCSDPRKV